MKPVDMAPIAKKYAGYFVALSDDRKEVLGTGLSAEEALEQARASGAKNPILAKVPEDNRSYLL